MKRTLVSLGLVLAVGCGPTVVVQPGTTGTGGSTAGTTTGGSTAGTTTGGTTTAGTTTSGTTTAGTTTSGTTTAGTTTSGTTTAGTTTGGTTAGTTTSGTTAGTTTSGTTAGTTGGTTAGTTGGTTAGTTGSTGGVYTPVAVDGKYDVSTQYNLLDALPPDVEEAFSLALLLAESPGAFVLEMAGRLPVIEYVVQAINIFSGVRDKITGAIDEYIDGWSGGMVTTVSGISKDISAALKGLKAHNRLVVGKPDANGNVTVEDTLRDLTFTYKGKDYAYPQGAKATTDGNITGLKLTVKEHTYDRGVRIGGILVDLIDNVALPQLTGVNSMGELLNQLVNCGGVASWVWGYIGNWCAMFGNTRLCIYDYISANDIAKLCQNALDLAGKVIEDQIAKLDAPGMMHMSDAECLAVENKGATGHADTLMGGKWSLTLPIGVADVTLPGDFSGVYVP